AQAALVGLLTNGLARPVARWHALWALDAIDQGRLARPHILTLAAGSDAALARQAIRQLGQRAAPEAASILHRRLRDPDPSIRFGAATALGRMGMAASVDVLLEALAAPERELWPRFALFTALNRIGRVRPQTWERMVPRLNTGDAATREAIRFAMRETHDASLVDALISLAKDAGALAQARAGAIELLRAAYRQSPAWKGEWWSYHPFRLAPPAHTEDWEATPRIAAAMLELLEDPDRTVRLAVVPALAE